MATRPIASPRPVHLTSWEIGVILGCSEATVNFHFANIRSKYGVGSRAAAFQLAHAQGLL